MLKILYTALCLFLFYIYSFSFAFSAKFSKETNDSIRWASETYQIPTIWLSVSMAGQDDYYNYITGGYNKGDDKKLRDDALFKIGGLTKTFTAEIVLNLINEKKIKYADKLEKWFPEYPVWKNITIRDLLYNTSGILDYTKSFRWVDKLLKNQTKIWKNKELLDIPYDGSVAFPGGTQLENSNTNYLLLGIIAEKVTNQNLSDLYNTLFAKNNLKKTFYNTEEIPENILNNLVHGYSREQIDAVKLNASWAQGMGGIYSNPNDLVVWFENLMRNKIEIFNKGQLPPDPKLPKAPPFQSPFLELVTLTPLKNFSFTGFTPALYSMTTSNGILWLSAGYFPGYLSFAGMFPCSGVVFAYSTSKLPRKVKFQEVMLQKFLKSLEDDEIINDKMNKYKSTQKLPKFCKNEDKYPNLLFPDEIKGLY
ncbi:serine hydrolase domain-containing protein [Fluviispira vulneris]|uniref:serine hydrolase domain-containing protein n=1 Tax=Fluviispira vulneris TaxID=2763012 RepID=UPI00164468EF|nr:serine hydrolase domain-containing protein [Fluviispira vulneris]